MQILVYLIIVPLCSGQHYEINCLWRALVSNSHLEAGPSCDTGALRAFFKRSVFIMLYSDCPCSTEQILLNSLNVTVSLKDGRAME